MTDTDYIRRAIALAQTARGRVEPNPMVGCVIVKEGRIIGEGCHARYGGPHAEPTALAACTESPEGATAYVTLEPCCHQVKQTPPCAPRLIEAKVARVVYGCVDPNPNVNGKGLAMLRDAGVDVEGPVLGDEAKQLIAPFIKMTTRPKLPYVTLKWAESANGKVAGARGERVRISNRATTRIVHELRARCDVVMVGINTVLTDNPMLTARDVADARTVLRYVLDRHLRLPLESQLVRTASAHPVVVGCGVSAIGSPQAKALAGAGVNVYPQPFLARALIDLQTRKVNGRLATHVLVEPGPTLARAFFDDGLADRVWVIRSPKSIDAPDSPTATPVPDHFVETASAVINGDTLTEYLNPASDVFFSNEPSADFLLAREAHID
jgi:diaminohydroxyphosphoribosylaminopyrimidine deaminase/5-amino-6-(5-phosphoribosylamino)uracil reductase